MNSTIYDEQRRLENNSMIEFAYWERIAVTQNYPNLGLLPRFVTWFGGFTLRALLDKPDIKELRRQATELLADPAFRTRLCERCRERNLVEVVDGIDKIDLVRAIAVTYASDRGTEPIDQSKASHVIAFAAIEVIGSGLGDYCKKQSPIVATPSAVEDGR